MNLLRRGKRQLREELEKLSNQELSRLQAKQYRQKEEPKLRMEEKKLGTSNWNTLSWIELLNRSVARHRRIRDLEDAKRLGIQDAEKLSSWELSSAVLSEQVRRINIKDLGG